MISLHNQIGSQLIESLITAAVLNLPTYTYSDIGKIQNIENVQFTRNNEVLSVVPLSLHLMCKAS